MKLTMFGIWGCLCSLFCLEVKINPFFSIGYVSFYIFAALTLIGLLMKWHPDGKSGGSGDQEQNS